MLHIYCKDGEEYVEQTPVLDLKKAFTAWGYRPAGVERGSEDAGLGTADGGNGLR